VFFFFFFHCTRQRIDSEQNYYKTQCKNAHLCATEETLKVKGKWDIVVWWYRRP